MVSKFKMISPVRNKELRQIGPVYLIENVDRLALFQVVDASDQGQDYINAIGIKIRVNIEVDFILWVEDGSWDLMDHYLEDEGKLLVRLLDDGEWITIKNV